MLRLWLPSLLLARHICGAAAAMYGVAELGGGAWPVASPGAPANVSIEATPSSAHVRWKHAPPSDGGLATHYVIKWMVKDGVEVHWHPEWVGVGSELVTLAELTPGSVYGVRIAAVNTQGRAWAPATTFRTLSGIRCDMTFHWGGLIDDADKGILCGDLAQINPMDPEASGGCSAGYTEYVLAGVAAGATISLVLASTLLNQRCTRRLFSLLPHAADEAPADEAPAVTSAASEQQHPLSSADEADASFNSSHDDGGAAGARAASIAMLRNVTLRGPALGGVPTFTPSAPGSSSSVTHGRLGRPASLDIGLAAAVGTDLSPRLRRDCAELSPAGLPIHRWSPPARSPRNTLEGATSAFDDEQMGAAPL